MRAPVCEGARFGTRQAPDIPERPTSGFVFGFDYGFRLDAVQQFGQSGFDVFSDVACHDNEQQIVAGLERSLFRFDDDTEDAFPILVFFAEFLDALEIGGYIHACYDLAIAARPGSDDAVVHEEHTYIVGKARFLFQLLDGLRNIHCSLLVFGV